MTGQSASGAAQDRYRGFLGCSSGRNIGCGLAHQKHRQYANREKGRVDPRHLVVPGHGHVQADGQCGADNRAGGGEDQVLHQKVLEDVGSPGAQCAADTDLPIPLADPEAGQSKSPI